MPFQRIVIVGCSGSGKSTLARKLGLRLGLPVVHLDVLHYLPGWKRASLAEFRARITEAHRGDAWISEGNFASWTFDIRLQRAEAVIMLERPRWLCLWRSAQLLQVCAFGQVQGRTGSAVASVKFRRRV
jgi:adenylate kinase family enzyme